MIGTSNKCIFLDRDGVLNEERGEYSYKIEDFKIIDGVHEALQILKKHNFLLIVITNQAGISKGIYTVEEMKACHEKLGDATGNIIDAIYFCPYHPNQTNSLCRKPDSLMFEKAIAKYKIDASASWMIGDKERDLIPAKKLGIKTILIGNHSKKIIADHYAQNLLEASGLIIN